MPTRITDIISQPFIRDYILATTLFCCGVTCGAEPIRSAESSTSEPNIALTKLQAITSRAADFSSRATELAMRAMGMIGIHYKFGSNSPENGLDCSGLVQYVFKEAWGAKLPRTSAEISQVGERIETKDMQPGDLVFYNTLKRGFSHVGIYLGDNKFIHAPSSGGQVRIESMDLSYWKNRFNGVRRINDPDQQ